MQRKKLYNELKRTGDLFEMYSNLTGDWEEDKNSFNEQQDALETFIKPIDTDGEFIN